MKNSAIEEGDRKHKSQYTERARENKILSNNPCVFDVFMLFPAITMQYL